MFRAASPFSFTKYSYSSSFVIFSLFTLATTSLDAWLLQAEAIKPSPIAKTRTKAKDLVMLIFLVKISLTLSINKIYCSY